MKIGMYVMKGHDQYRRKVTTDSEEIEGGDITDATPFMDYREVQVRQTRPAARQRRQCPRGPGHVPWSEGAGRSDFAADPPPLDAAVPPNRPHHGNATRSWTPL